MIGLKDWINGIFLFITTSVLSFPSLDNCGEICTVSLISFSSVLLLTHFEFVVAVHSHTHTQICKDSETKAYSISWGLNSHLWPSAPLLLEFNPWTHVNPSGTEALAGGLGSQAGVALISIDTQDCLHIEKFTFQKQTITITSTVIIAYVFFMFCFFKRIEQLFHKPSHFLMLRLYFRESPAIHRWTLKVLLQFELNDILMHARQPMGSE